MNFLFNDALHNTMLLRMKQRQNDTETTYMITIELK